MGRTHIIIAALVLIMSISCRNQMAQQNYLFDMGSASIPAPEGFTKVLPDRSYSTATGYGWVQGPYEPFSGNNNKIPNKLALDGVISKDGSLVFQVDLTDGDYFVTITAGTNEDEKINLRILINDINVTDSLQAPWYRLSWRTLRRKISISGGKALVKITGNNTPAILQAIEFRPVLSLTAGNLPKTPEQDTTAVQQLALDLEKKAGRDSADLASLNQLHTIRQYLQACKYYNMGGWSWANQQTGLSLIYRMYLTADLLEQVVADPNDPLYSKAAYMLGRVHYWLDAELGDAWHESQSRYYFNLLKPSFPDHEVLRMYLGEKIPYDTSNFSVPGAPQWAVYQREAMSRMLRLIKWWVEVKQTPNGELGGKYGDDVEILRWWMPAILGADDLYARKGFEHLADGVWNSGLLDRGFAKKMDDVEHAAELFSDTHPAMLMINYGDPAYVERCMISMQHFRDTWTAITPKGHRHFKSCYLSSTEVSKEYPMDVPLNARACRAGLWTAWYNRHPAIVKMLGEWGKAWVQDAARTDNGKPAGLLPAAVQFPNESFGGTGKLWYEANLPYDYYNWESTGHINELQYQLLGLYAITGDRSFLDPLNAAANLMAAGNGSPTTAKPVAGTAAWAREQLIGGEVNSTGKLFSLAKRLTKGNQYDSLIAQFGQPYNKYSITKNTAEILKGFEPLLEGLRYNFPMLTDEVIFTDRVYVPGSALLSGMYTGHFSNGYEYPSPMVTWKGTGPNTSIFVRNGDNRSLTVSLYRFGDEATLTMNTWMLEPGTYTMKRGVDTNDDGTIDEEYDTRHVTLTERVNAIQFVPRSRQNIVITLEQESGKKEIPALAPDLAISGRDISITPSAINKEEGLIQYTIHNIGSMAARNVRVELRINDQTVDQQTIALLEAPLDLKPRTRNFTFKAKFQQGRNSIRVRISCPQREITQWNNEATTPYAAQSNNSSR